MQLNNYGHQPMLPLNCPHSHILQLKWTKINWPVLCSSNTACFHLKEHECKYWNQIVLHILWRLDTPWGNVCFQDLRQEGLRFYITTNIVGTPLPSGIYLGKAMGTRYFWNLKTKNPEVNSFQSLFYTLSPYKNMGKHKWILTDRCRYFHYICAWNFWVLLMLAKDYMFHVNR